MLGFGRSGVPGPGFPWSLEGLMADALEVARAAGAERFHFVGESVGGTVGLLLGSRRPDALLSLTVSNASHRGGSIQRAREWREFIRVNGMAKWGEMMTPLRLDRDRVPEAQYRWFERAQAQCSADSVLDLADVLIGSDLSPELGRIPRADAAARSRPEPVRAARGHGGDARGHRGLGARRLSRTRATACRARTAPRAAGRSAPSSTAAPPSPMPVSPAVAETTDALLAALLGALDRVEWAQRQLFPPRALELADRLAPHAERLAGPLCALEAAAWPDDLRLLRERLAQVTRQAIELIGAFTAAAPDRRADRALPRPAPLRAAAGGALPARAGAGSGEPLVPRAGPPRRRRAGPAPARRARSARTAPASACSTRATTTAAAAGSRSTCPRRGTPGGPPAPLVVALHGGSGHGRDFLWAWLREARSRGVLLLSPTALDRTWSIMGGEDVDAPRLQAAVEDVAARYHVDRTRVLLTGMSDGATYALLCGLAAGMPFTHLAPACGVLHPFLLARGDIQHARGRPIYLVHGALDWMFPVQTARMSRRRARDGGGAGRLPRDRGPLAHLPAGREPADPRLAAGPGQLVGVGAAKRLIGSGVVTAPRHAAAT